jgi:hypothetical protein
LFQADLKLADSFRHAFIEEMDQSVSSGRFCPDCLGYIVFRKGDLGLGVTLFGDDAEEALWDVGARVYGHVHLSSQSIKLIPLKPLRDPIDPNEGRG